MVIMTGTWDGGYTDAFEGRRVTVYDAGAVPKLGGFGPKANWGAALFTGI